MKGGIPNPMEEKQKKEETAQDATQKKSKRFLAVYIIGLFSIALVLILLSYLTQVRADKQLDAMNHQLSEQVSAAQGATQKMNLLQETVEEQTKKLNEQQKLLEEITELTGNIGLQEESSLEAKVQLLRERYLALDSLQQVRRAMEQNNLTQAKDGIDGMIRTYTLERLTNGSAEDAVLLGANAAEFVQYQAALTANTQTEQ